MFTKERAIFLIGEDKVSHTIGGIFGLNLAGHVAIAGCYDIIVGRYVLELVGRVGEID